jgi:mRNA interferase RelE/StbE
VSAYTIFVTRNAWPEIKALPGNVRQRAKKAIDALAENPRPANSKALELADPDVELRRLRLDRWRIVYLVTESERTIDVVAIRKRPPYDYGDLERLLSEIH